MLKDMTALNKKRFGVYCFIFVVLAAITAGGVFLNMSGHGVAGKMRQDLQPYVNKFNSLSKVKRVNNTKNSSMIARINDTGIMVTYKNNGKTSKVAFIFKTETNYQKYLEVKYNKNESDVEEVVKNMIEAVSVSKGNLEGAVFTNFDYSYFLNTKFTDGLELKSSSSTVIARINLDVNLLTKLGGNNFSTSNTEFEITYDNTSTFEEFATYTLPENFSNDTNEHQIGTENNTCVAKFNVISTYTATSANEFATLLADSKSTTAETQDINGYVWNKVVYTGSQGGLVTYYSIDVNDRMIGFEYEAFYDNTECEGYLTQIVDSLRVKELIKEFFFY